MVFMMNPIGRVSGGRSQPIDDAWGASRASIELDPATFDASALMGLDQFSHAEIIYVFDKVTDEEIIVGARHPRGRQDWPKIGIFAQRGKNRPNRIGVTLCRILRVDGLRLDLEGLDAINGTPVLDVKPYLTGFSPRGGVFEPDWARDIMADYW